MIKKKSTYIVVLVLFIIIATAIAISMGVACFAWSIDNEDFMPSLSFIIIAGIAYFLYWLLRDDYDTKLSVTVGITTFLVLSVIVGLINAFSDFAAVVVESCLWTIVILAVEAFVIYKVLGISKDEYDKLD